MWETIQEIMALHTRVINERTARELNASTILTLVLGASIVTQLARIAEQLGTVVEVPVEKPKKRGA